MLWWAVLPPVLPVGWEKGGQVLVRSVCLDFHRHNKTREDLVFDGVIGGPNEPSQGRRGEAPAKLLGL